MKHFPRHISYSFQLPPLVSFEKTQARGPLKIFVESGDITTVLLLCVIKSTCVWLNGLIILSTQPASHFSAFALSLLVISYFICSLHHLLFHSNAVLLNLLKNERMHLLFSGRCEGVTAKGMCNGDEGPTLCPPLNVFCGKVELWN